MPPSPPILIDVLEDSAPLSPLGKSIAYRLRTEHCELLVDCGAPVFHQLGPEEVDRVDGIVATHSHEDHKRWFTDILLHRMYVSQRDDNIDLYSSREVLEEFRTSSGPALERTLSPDARRVVNRSFDEYAATHPLGPEPKFRCRRSKGEEAESEWRVEDRDGEKLPPHRARVVLASGGSKPRMLYRDPEDEIWVEPSSYYAYDDARFYVQPAERQTTFPGGLSLTPVKATAWHGPPTLALLFELDGQRVFFSSDTVYDPKLWEKLATPETPESSPESGEFSGRHLIRGDINEFIEQTWSRERLSRAREMYQGEQLMVHDASALPSPVHTDYSQLEDHTGPLLLTHAPHSFTSLHPPAMGGKTFEYRNRSLYERTGTNNRYSLHADCFVKEGDSCRVGFHDPDGSHLLVRIKPGRYEVIPSSRRSEIEGSVVDTVSMFEDVDGEYFPYLEDENQHYALRPDGRVERRTRHRDGSRGEVVEGRRAQLEERAGG